MLWMESRLLEGSVLLAAHGRTLDHPVWLQWSHMHVLLLHYLTHPGAPHHRATCPCHSLHAMRARLQTIHILLLLNHQHACFPIELKVLRI